MAPFESINSNKEILVDNDKDNKSPLKAEAKAEPSVALSAVQEMIDKAVAAAMAQRVHQHTPIGQVLQKELSGRSREEGTLVVSKLDETKGYVEFGFNDGTVRRDYK
jgi:hypothetical protein